MGCPGLIGVLLMLGQVPPPGVGPGAAAELEVEKRSIVANEGAELKRLAERLAQEGDQAGAQRIRERMPRPLDPDGPTHFVPLPELVPARPERKEGEPWRARLNEIESRSAQSLFTLAQRAAKTDPPSYSLASRCLRAVLKHRLTMGRRGG